MKKLEKNEMSSIGLRKLGGNVMDLYSEWQGLERISYTWNHIGDELSKEIYSMRMMYFLTKDIAFLRRIVLTTAEGRECYEKLKGNKGKKVIFGAGIFGKSILNIFSDIAFECFIDNYASHKSMCGLPIFPIEKLKDYGDDSVVVIASRIYNRPIMSQLLDFGIPRDRIINGGGLIDDMITRQYFDLPELKQCGPKELESFVDAGCLDGRSSILFTEWCKGYYSKIWVFEPDKKNSEVCRNNFQRHNIKNYEIIEKGLWETESSLGFRAQGNGLSHIITDTSTEDMIIEVVGLDRLLEKEKITFIKMDIEGAEYQALSGAGEIIAKQKPKLAISIYHKPEDIIILPELILSLNADYKFYLRHYSICSFETVLYAI